MNLYKQYSDGSGLGGLLGLGMVYKVDGRRVYMLGEGDIADCLLLAVHFEFCKTYSADVGHLAEKR
jgi:hypothetical protein